jgi:hypothetical protein
LVRDSLFALLAEMPPMAPPASVQPLHATTSNRLRTLPASPSRASS